MAKLFGAMVLGSLIVAATAISGPLRAETPSSTPSIPVQAFVPPPAKDGYAYPDCYCTDGSGRRVELGQRICLTVGGETYLARCDMSLNTPTWRREADICPTM